MCIISWIYFHELKNQRNYNPLNWNPLNCLEICTMRGLGKAFSCLEMIPLHLGLSVTIVQLVSQEYMSSYNNHIYEYTWQMKWEMLNHMKFNANLCKWWHLQNDILQFTTKGNQYLDIWTQMKQALAIGKLASS